MAGRWLNRFELLDVVIKNNMEGIKKAGFEELLDIIRPGLTVYYDRGKPIPIDIQLLLILRSFATGTFQMACRDLCDISQASASHIILMQVSEAIRHLKTIT